MGRSEWELIKFLLRIENSAYTPNSQPRIPTRVCQGHVVNVDLPTLGTNPEQSRSGSTTQEAKDLAILRSDGRTVREPRADGPRTLADGPLPTGGRSVNRNRMTRRAPQHADGPSWAQTFREQLMPCEQSVIRKRTVRPPRGRSGTPTRTVR
jgi:hypothetical protein